MKIITDTACTSYSHAGHPERPERIEASVERLKNEADLGLTWQGPALPKEEALHRAHTEEHLARLREPEEFDMDTPSYPGIDGYARASAGAAIEAMRTARSGANVLSLMRPPGHHATRSRAMGFCYINNVAVAVLEALAQGAKRVAVYDFDVHHGNGTEAILLNKPGAAFYSIHQFPCYPGTGTRNVGDNCFNFPLPPRTPRAEYRQVLQSAIDAMAKWKPDLVAVSAGFDCYAKDPLAQQTLEMEDFQWVGCRLRALGVPMFSVLEGGYSDDLPELIVAYIKGVLGK